MALRQINMIPANVLARTAITRHLLFWSKGLVLILLVFVMFYFVQLNGFARKQKAQYSDASMKAKIASQVTQTRKDADDMNAMIQDLKLKSGLLATLTSQQQYYDILAVFAGAFNDQTWINNLSIQRGQEEGKDSSQLMVDGFSQSHNTLGTFLESLSTNPRIQEVVLVYAKKLEEMAVKKDQPPVIQFKLTCAITKGSKK